VHLRCKIAGPASNNTGKRGVSTWEAVHTQELELSTRTELAA